MDTHRLNFSEHEGTDEWSCPICGRVVLVEFLPVFRKVVVEEGDIYSAHSGSVGGLSLTTFTE